MRKKVWKNLKKSLKTSWYSFVNGIVECDFCELYKASEDVGTDTQDKLICKDCVNKVIAQPDHKKYMALCIKRKRAHQLNKKLGRL